MFPSLQWLGQILWKNFLALVQRESVTCLPVPGSLLRAFSTLMKLMPLADHDSPSEFAVLFFYCYLQIINNYSTSAHGYEVIDSQRGTKRRVGYNHLISNKREWNNCFIKNHQQILLYFADFAWLEQPEGNLMDAISSGMV